MAERVMISGATNRADEPDGVSLDALLTSSDGQAALVDAVSEALPDALDNAGMTPLNFKLASFNSAQLLAMNTTPLVVIPAAPSGCVHVVLSTIYKYSFLTAAYTESAAPKLTYGGVYANAADAGMGTLLTNTANRVMAVAGAGFAAIASGSVEAQNVSLTDSANPAAGGGSLEIIVAYITINVG